MEPAVLQRLLAPYGPYAVAGKIGSGATAEVFKARRQRPNGFGKDVAIKVASPQSAEAAELIERFSDEAKLAGTLRHDNIVQVTDFFELDGHLAIELELIEGLTLLSVLRLAKKFRVRIPPVVCKYVMVEVLDALEYVRAISASSRTSIVHRDIKPANVFVNRNGAAKVADFGVAHVPDSERTQRGMLLGTYRYLPLNAFVGESADHSWDVWACSVVLWELLTQRRAFPLQKDLRPNEIMAQMVNALRRSALGPPAALMDDVPASLSSLVHASVQPPLTKTTTAGDMREALIAAEPTAPFPREAVRRFVQTLESLDAGQVVTTGHLVPLEKHWRTPPGDARDGPLSSMRSTASLAGPRAPIHRSPQRGSSQLRPRSLAHRAPPRDSSALSGGGRVAAESPGSFDQGPTITASSWRTFVLSQQTTIWATVVMMALAATIWAIGPDKVGLTTEPTPQDAPVVSPSRP